MKVQNLIDFLKFTQQFKSTKRSIFSNGENRMENDSEHSYQLAVTVWYVIQNEKLRLDSNLAIKYALVHDLEEALTGDIHIFDDKGRESKEKGEIKARKQILKMFPNWDEYKELSQNYKLLKDNESKLVNGLDKILPVLNIYLDRGRTWKKEGMTLSKIENNKRETTKIHPLTEKLWKDIEKLLQSSEKELFIK